MSCALTSADYSGGQAFRFRAIGCEFTAEYGVFPFITRGLYVGWESAGSYAVINNQYHFGHTASEWTLQDCTFAGTHRLELCGNQTVNMTFMQSMLIGYQYGEGPCVLINGAAVKFCGLVGMNTGTLFSLGADSSVRATDLFLDKNSVSLIDINSHTVGRVDISSGVDVAGFDFIVRSPVSTELQRIKLRDWDKYRPDVTLQDSVAYCAAYHRLSIDVDGSTGLAPYLNLSQPDSSDFSGRTAMYNLSPDLFPPSQACLELGAQIDQAEAGQVNSNIIAALRLLLAAQMSAKPSYLIQS